ncbi:PorP/SprF family type IX secretion system membrane protein [Pedobacter boryungensis]|uniref:Type IX secretion system membrane protein PorP/SprF n=1 Tax=Pedobacter boryungensis TaxID=869962 RepID=A0ABX2D980_9SPHI|nr:type IX secretion system membrane protein PorP/SprF [Pedobacter boryungensis]NQX30584.1 type IX secretion system membrane protein PorP/SprF [Pedobacter boryungensis]
MKTNKNIIVILLTVPFLWAVNSQKVKAQLNPLGMLYYSNQYLGNPAMAGVDEGLNINLGHRQQWSGVPGAPSTQALTAEYGKNKVGLGLNLNNDVAGLLKRTRVAATYAYHLPLSDSQKLHFGISLGMMYERVENEMIDGDPTDASLGKFARKENYFDGDFGVAYTSNGLTIQGAIPNLQQFIKKETNFKSVDKSTFLTAVSYYWTLDPQNNASLEPKVTFRGVKGYHNIVDVGVNLGLVEDKVSIIGIYHSSKSATFGLGSTYKSFFLMGMYTTETAALRSYVNGEFELSLGYKFAKNVKK